MDTGGALHHDRYASFFLAVLQLRIKLSGHLIGQGGNTLGYPSRFRLDLGAVRPPPKRVDAHWVQKCPPLRNIIHNQKTQFPSMKNCPAKSIPNFA